ncbi:MAG: polyphenol oxidase family protein [Planctomycetota bacterium]
MPQLERRARRDGLVTYRSPSLAALEVPHVFTTRRGPRGGELDLRELDAGARAELLRAVGLPQATLVHARQVHGADVHASDAPLPAEAPTADALRTARHDRVLAVWTADCVPVLLASPEGAPVAAVHAGWRGLVGEVLPRAVEALGEVAVAAIGPCLSTERFEVGEEVAEAFRDAGLAETVHPVPGARPHVDLRAAAHEQLRRCGVPIIDSTDRCTWRDAAEFYSYRRDVTHGGQAHTGRLAALIGVANG